MSTAHVYVYGVIEDWQSSEASEWGSVSLTSIKNQIDAQSSAKDVLVHIHSAGGDVNEGFAIYDYLKSLGKPINTVIEGNCFSIATIIALAGEERTMTSNSEFLIHNPWGWAMGEKEDIKKYADQLEKAENTIAEFYAKKTNLPIDEVLMLMKQETSFTPEEAQAKGFITKVKETLKAVALFNPKQMNKKETDTLVNKIIAGIKNIGKSDKIQNKIIQDANGVEIDFYEVEETATPAVGDKARVDGSDAEGEYLLPSGETYVFTAGELTEIQTGEEEAEDEGLEALKAENESLKQQLADAQANMSAKEDELSGIQGKLKGVEKDIYNLKAMIVSEDVDHTPKQPNKKEKSTSRKLFKD